MPPPVRTRFDSRDESVLHLLPPSSADRSPLKSWRNIPTPTGTGDFQHLERQLEFDELDLSKDGDTAKTRPPKARTINYITLGFIAYFAVASGPFGVEDAVRAAGAYPVLIAVVLLPFTWGLPQALMVRCVV